MPSFHVAGVTFANPNGTGRQEILATLKEGTPVSLVPEPINKYDPHAVAVFASAGQIGYVPKKYLAELPHRLPSIGEIESIRSHGEGKSLGAWVKYEVQP